MFQEHILPENLNVRRFSRNEYYDEGNFVIEPYVVESFEDGKITLSRVGCVRQGSQSFPLEIRKTYELIGSHLNVKYDLANLSDRPLVMRLGIESNFAMSAGDAFDHYYTASEGNIGPFKLLASLSRRTFISLTDDWRNFRATLNWSEPVDLWLFPVYTVSQSESGFEKVFQGAVVMPVFGCEIKCGDTKSIELQLEIEQW